MATESRLHRAPRGPHRPTLIASPRTDKARGLSRLRAGDVTYRRVLDSFRFRGPAFSRPPDSAAHRTSRAAFRIQSSVHSPPRKPRSFWLRPVLGENTTSVGNASI